MPSTQIAYFTPKFEYSYCLSIAYFATTKVPYLRDTNFNGSHKQNQVY